MDETLKSPPTIPLLSELRTLVSASTKYAGIGSRQAPPAVLALIVEIAKNLAFRGLTLRSGGAPGADTAFETGCDQGRGEKEIFLPWKAFNNHASPFDPPPEQAEWIAALCHPNWRNCNAAARKLHARNCQQVYGVNLDDPVHFVLFWAPEKDHSVQGGTATAVTLARRMNIPTFNLWQPDTLKAWSTLVRIEKRKYRSC
ncbi:MAG TPA: hypothetical protein VNQ90_12380 [Chthoniobacteraceae bacterium]|nr:hypothetical protein [Chthoniobacteraceae bacterium]